MTVIELIREIYSSDIKNLIIRMNDSDIKIKAAYSHHFIYQNLLRNISMITYYDSSPERNCYYLYASFLSTNVKICFSFYINDVKIRKFSTGDNTVSTIVTIPVDNIFDDELTLVLKYGRILVEELKI